MVKRLQEIIKNKKARLEAGGMEGAGIQYLILGEFGVVDHPEPLHRPGGRP